MGWASAAEAQHCNSIMIHHFFPAPEEWGGLLACSTYPCWRAFDAPALNLSLN